MTGGGWSASTERLRNGAAIVFTVIVLFGWSAVLLIPLAVLLGFLLP